MEFHRRSVRGKDLSTETNIHPDSSLLLTHRLLSNQKFRDKFGISGSHRKRLISTFRMIDSVFTFREYHPGMVDYDTLEKP
jgi:hypothetical protein